MLTPKSKSKGATWVSGSLNAYNNIVYLDWVSLGSGRRDADKAKCFGAWMKRIGNILCDILLVDCHCGQRTLGVGVGDSASSLPISTSAAASTNRVANNSNIMLDYGPPILNQALELMVEATAKVRKAGVIMNGISRKLAQVMSIPSGIVAMTFFSA